MHSILLGAIDRSVVEFETTSDFSLDLLQVNLLNQLKSVNNSQCW